MRIVYENGLGEEIESPILAEFTTTPEDQWLVVFDRVHRLTILPRDKVLRWL